MTVCRVGLLLATLDLVLAVLDLALAVLDLVLAVLDLDLPAPDLVVATLVLVFGVSSRGERVLDLGEFFTTVCSPPDRVPDTCGFVTGGLPASSGIE